ncbi:MAG: aldehyde dehydrogenase family protein [Pseudomonadota bacterium]
MKESIFAQLKLADKNPGTFIGSTPVGTPQRYIDSDNPSTGEHLGSVGVSSSEDYEQVIAAAQAAFEEWRRVPAPLRGEAMRVCGQALRDHKDALGSLVALEMGKIKAEGDGEVQEMIDIADFAVGQSRMMYGKTMHSERPQHRMYEQWHPLGIVGVISAFNFPVAVWSWNAFIAAMAGNVVIWKPSQKTVLCGVAVQKICNDALAGMGLPQIFHLFNDDGNDLAKAFVDDRRVALMSFTGSCEVGNIVGAQVAKRMGRSLLELGGNNALIVDREANMDLAVPAIVFGAVGTAGQRCTSTRRVFVHRDREQELLGTLKKAYAQVRIGNPLDENTLMGPLIDKASVQRFSDAVSAVQKAGGTLITGGDVLDQPGNFVTPAIATAKNEWQIVQDETFAPLLYVIAFDTIDDAIAMQNDVRQGLSSAIFTDNLQNAEQFLAATGSDCGIANVNIGTSGAEIGGAFGGEKETGGGREAGSDAWQAYMRRQTNTINWGRDLPLAQGINFDLG